MDTTQAGRHGLNAVLLVVLVLGPDSEPAMIRRRVYRKQTVEMVQPVPRAQLASTLALCQDAKFK